jgi:hypothetical protein
MADTSSITNFSRRAILAGGGALVAIGNPKMAAGTVGDARLAALAKIYWRNLKRIDDLIAEAEHRYGPGAWLGPSYETRYNELAAYEERVITAVAETPPDSIVGLATKMRVAILGEDFAGLPGGDILETVFHPALRDLARLAAEAKP